MAFRNSAQQKNSAQQRSLQEIAGRQCAKLLFRLRQTIPFPCSPTEVMYDLLPPEVRELCLLEDFKQAPEKRQAQLENFYLTCAWARQVHVAIHDAPHWRQAIQGKGRWDKVFWMNTSMPVPIHDMTVRPYRLFEEHLNYLALCEWFDKATDLDQRISRYVEVIRAFAKFSRHEGMLQRVWPDLMKFVKVKGPTMTHISPNIVSKVQQNVRHFLGDPKLMQEITEALAMATLLDESKIDAWVSFKTPED